ncbi:MAG: hypothetical protein H0V76_01110 [Blastocatellia bacterium]|nr:hypothetical protein [Blastocatellia bacterium]
MRAKYIGIFVVMTLLAAGISAQPVYTPKHGTAERKATLDALRVPVEREYKQKIAFVIDEFKVQGTWAFISGSAQTPDGNARA